jgi:flagellin-specific chaperone FliS
VTAVSALSELEAEVLSALKSISKGSRAEFDLEELAARVAGRVGGTVNITPETLESVLLALEQKGYLRITKVPSTSKIIKEKLKEKVKELNAAFISGKLDPPSYAAQFSEITSRCPSLAVRPLTPASFSDALRSLMLLLRSLERLESVPGGSGAKEELKKEYVAKVEELLKEMSSLMEEAKSVAEHLLGLYRELERRLETIRLDEQVRGVDRSVERAALQERMQEVVKELEAVRRWVLGAPADPTKLEQLKKRLSELEAERELLEVRLLIEGRKDLQEALDRLTREIAQLRVEMERASIESKPVDAIAESARVLRERGLLPDHLYNVIASLLKELKIFEMMTEKS